MVQTYFSQISDKYQLQYFDAPIHISLEHKEAYKSIVGDCYKQVLHLSTNNTYLGIMRPEITYMASKTINHNSKNLYYISECYRNETTQFLRFRKFVQLGCEFFVQTEKKKNNKRPCDVITSKKRNGDY